MSGLILVVEDERDLVATLEYNLQQAHYRTRSALTGRAGIELCRQEPIPDLVVLDLMLPDISGLEVCRSIRSDPRTSGVPVLMLTARGEEIDRVVGFEVGADDYVVKPFSVRELLLRVAAILRRVRSPEPKGEQPIRFGRLEVEQDAYQVRVDGAEIGLTVLEFKLLATLVTRRGRVQTRERLLEDVWGYQADVTTRTVDTHVKRLREKLGGAGCYIETVRGVGYRFRSRPESEEP
ncbi:MAG: response regulator transcription factor [Bradymonadales bacterium]|nr:response regulator transcription factor [Bradymonadales bacterium]